MNIFQKAITPDMPRVLEGEQIYVYVPRATSTNAGIASYNRDHFDVIGSEVSLKWPAEYFVQKVPQNLTDAEQQQARENIGAGSLAVVEQSNQNSSAALKAANNALINSTDATNIANKALHNSTDATNIANDALSNSAEAFETANSALSNSAEATNIANEALSNSIGSIDISNEAKLKANEAFEISNTAKQTSVNAIQTAQESNTISTEAKIIAQNALDLITEGVGTQILVNGVSVATFNADTKADVTYVNHKIDEIMGPGSTEAIDTILELAAAFKTNSDVIKVLNTSISTKADKSEIPTEYIKSASVSTDGKTLTITPLTGNSISFKGGIELPTNLVTTDTNQSIGGVKTFTSMPNMNKGLQFVVTDNSISATDPKLTIFNRNVSLFDANPTEQLQLGQINVVSKEGGYLSKLITLKETNGIIRTQLQMRTNSATDGIEDWSKDLYRTMLSANLAKDGSYTITTKTPEASANDTQIATTAWVTNKTNNYLSIALAEREFTPLVPKGTSIPSSANLNTIDYLKVGNYNCTGDSTAATLTNCPTTRAFIMQVLCPNLNTYDDEATKTWRYRLRIITDRLGNVYYQSSNSAGTAGSFTYSKWKQVITSAGGTITDGTLSVNKGSDWAQFKAYSASGYYRAFEADDNRARIDVRNATEIENRRYLDIFNSVGKSNVDEALVFTDVVNGVYTTYPVATQAWVTNLTQAVAQTISGNKTFTGTVIVPDVTIT